jgi:hypothetical protein
MHHHSRFDQLVAATEELIHESERMRLNIRPLRQRFRKSWTTKRPYGALRKATSEVTRLTMQHLEGDEAHRPSHIVAQVRPALGGTVTPIYWAQHHYIFKLFQKTNHLLNLLNLFFLLCIAFLPFPTQVLNEYMLDSANQTAAATFYAFGLLLPAGSWFLMWLYATHGRRIVDNRLDPGYLRRMTVQYGGSVALYLGAVLVSLIDFRWGLGLCVGLTLLYLLPPPRPRYVDDQS